MSLFGNNNQDSEVVKKVKSELEKLERKINLLEENHEREVDNLKKDHELEMRRAEAEIDVKVAEARNEDRKKIASLELENGNLKKEVEILTKAFENLGFDVKDMKEILNKLVDGVVSKNQIQLISSK